MEYEEKELKEYLENAYWKEKKSLKEIGYDLNFTPPTVHDMMKKFKIRTRTVKEAMKLWWKKRKAMGLV